MTTVFKTTLRPILILSQFLGLINISYTLQPTGLIVRDTQLKIYLLLELARTCALLTCTYILYEWELFTFIELILLLKFWSVIIAARLSEIWIIKLINGIIEFDQKTALLSTYLSVEQGSLSKRFFNTVYILLLVYFIGFELSQQYLWSLNKINIHIIIRYLFDAPFIMDFAVLISSFFFLLNLNNRFQVLIDFLKFLPVESDFPNAWTHSKIAKSMEEIRLLHSELSELLKVFSLGYGPLLLSFFVFSFINLVFQLFLSICFKMTASNLPPLKMVLINTLPVILNIQIVIFTISTVVTVSLINDKKMKMISFLRLYRISNLHADIKRQIKMFMLQLSFYELDEISTYGFFNIDLNIVMSIIVLLITGLITMIQMKNHPIILNMINSTLTVAAGMFGI